MTEIAERLSAALPDHYQLERRLGEGGMATVYLAEDLKHKRKVAVKVLRPELAATLGPERFVREIEIAARLTHPHILPLFDSGEADGFVYYVMPYIEGESLRERLVREKQLPIADALQIAREVGDALDYAHANGVIHRDIKPENILLSRGHAVVSDFGIARAVTAAGEDRLTLTGMTVGTPAYMSPEQAGGQVDLDGRTDIYSLGCVLYEMLAAHPPFTGTTPQEVMARHAIDAVPSIRAARGTVAGTLEHALARALAKQPADRFGTAAAFNEALVVDLPGQRRGFRAVGVVGAGAFMLIVTLVVLWRSRPPAGTPVATGNVDPARVAVLYFDDHSPDGDLGHLVSGFTEGLIHELSEIEALSVVSRNGVKPFREGDVASDSIGRALQVGSLVTGSVARSGDRFRVSVQLIDAPTGRQLESRIVDEQWGDLFALQDRLAEHVSDFLRIRIGREISLRERRTTTSSVDAWEVLQHAQHLAGLAFDATAEAPMRELLVRQADSLLAQAVLLDRAWATPHIERGWLAYRRGRSYGLDQSQNDAATGEALKHAERALALDPRDSRAIELRATAIYWRYLLRLDTRIAQQQVEEARLLFDSAVAVNPQNASALTSLAHLHLNRGRTAEAKATALRAYEADPYLESAELTLTRLFDSSTDLGQVDEARRWCREASRRFPDSPRSLKCQLILTAFPGGGPEIEEAWRLVERYVALVPAESRVFRLAEAQVILAAGLAEAGLGDSARQVAQRARRDSTVDPTGVLHLWEAIMSTRLGEYEKAVELLGLYGAMSGTCNEDACDGSLLWYKGLETYAPCRELLRCARR